MYNEYDVDLIWGKTISEKFKMYHRINLKHKVLFLHSKHFFLKLLEFCVYHSGGFSMNSKEQIPQKYLKANMSFNCQEYIDKEKITWTISLFIVMFYLTNRTILFHFLAIKMFPQCPNLYEHCSCYRPKFCTDRPLAVFFCP